MQVAWHRVLVVAALIIALNACTPLPPVRGADPATSAASAPSWQLLHPAVSYAVQSPLPDSRLHVVRLDLRHPGLRLVVSPIADKGRRVDQMASAQGALASINASFFDGRFNALGITASGGERWPGVMQAERAPLFGCTAAMVCAFRLQEPITDPTSWHEVVAGRPWLIEQGKLRTTLDDASCDSLCARQHPRTALGLDVSGRWLFLVLAEGRRPPVLGLTLAQLAGAMRGLGVHNALNLDGGGSSSLHVRGQLLMARPLNEQQLRRVANALHVFVDESR
jgi:hypothetical protein